MSDGGKPPSPKETGQRVSAPHLGENNGEVEIAGGKEIFAGGMSTTSDAGDVAWAVEQSAEAQPTSGSPAEDPMHRAS